MNKIWFTSDTHFYHKNIMKFCPNTRKGADYLEMTELLIANWQAQVAPNDIVYHLGDFSFGDHEKTSKVLDRLPGQKYFIEGNHDKTILGSGLRKHFIHVAPYMRHRINEIDVVMFHYPIKEWDRMHRGSYHLYGHVHGEDMGLQDRRALDVGVDNRPHGDMLLWSWDEVHAVLKDRPIAKHH